MIARHSPELACEVGLLKSAPEKKREVWEGWPGQSILSGPICSQTIAKYGRFLHLSQATEQISLQSRLNGGEGGIRTLGTVLSR